MGPYSFGSDGDGVTGNKQTKIKNNINMYVYQIFLVIKKIFSKNTFVRQKPVKVKGKKTSLDEDGKELLIKP